MKGWTMKFFNRVLFNCCLCAVFPVVADAAGTYYDGNRYQNPQNRYGVNSAGYSNGYNTRGYGQNMQNIGVRKTVTTTVTKKSQQATKKSGKNGFSLDVGASHEFADWDFEMKNAGSKLHYDGLRWNVISGNAAYYFGGSTPMQIKAGARYGVQYGEIPMVDDDISSEAMWEPLELDVDGNQETAITGTPAISIGAGKGGSQFGFNASFGLTDFFKMGNLKITPSIGYRYFQYKVETKKNYGLMIDVLNSATFVNCIEVQNGELQCSPYIGFADATGLVFGFAGFAVDADGHLLTNEDGSYVIYNNTSATQIDVGNTYYYEQSGTSHSYETSWAGPYVALDMEYAVNDNNFMNLGLEFGLPIYNSKGDQPYRFDWAHPTSVEDKGDFGDAWHFGLNGNWATQISDGMSLNFGFMYDYYFVKDATATTYLNPSQYEEIYDAYKYYYDNDQLTAEGLEYFQSLQELKSNGWASESKSEIESIYKSLGFRVGLNLKF